MQIHENMTLDEIREVFSRDLYATQTTGCRIDEAGPDYAKCSLKLTDMHRNAMGAVMGGVYFTLGDFAFAVAANLAGVPTVSAASSIQFLSAAKGDTLTAKARCLKNGRNTCFFEVEIMDETQRTVCMMNVTASHVSR